jgi:hypothetical protein
MPGSNKDLLLPERLHKLLYWLANEDVYTSDYVRGWLERTPPEQAADDLFLIARLAQPEPHSIWYAFLRATIMVLATADSVSELSPAGRKAGLRAALLLAKRGDTRAIAPLARVFETEGMWKGRYQDAIEAALLQLLSGGEGQSGIHEYAEALRGLAAQIWRSSRGKDLPPRLADLLIAALRRLSIEGAPEDITLFKSIASQRTTTPNWARVQQTASSLVQ